MRKRWPRWATQKRKKWTSHLYLVHAQATELPSRPSPFDPMIQLHLICLLCSFDCPYLLHYHYFPTFCVLRCFCFRSDFPFFSRALLFGSVCQPTALLTLCVLCHPKDGLYRQLLCLHFISCNALAFLRHRAGLNCSLIIELLRNARRFVVCIYFRYLSLSLTNSRSQLLVAFRRRPPHPREWTHAYFRCSCVVIHFILSWTFALLSLTLPRIQTDKYLWMFYYSVGQKKNHE